VYLLHLVLIGADLRGGAAYSAAGTSLVQSSEFSANSLVFPESTMACASGSALAVQSAFIKDSLFLSNNASMSLCSSATMTPAGGAVASLSGGSVVVDECVFYNNTAAFGGALMAQTFAYLNSSRFSGNTALQGGAVSFGGVLFALSSEFIDNT